MKHRNEATLVARRHGIPAHVIAHAGGVPSEVRLDDLLFRVRNEYLEMPGLRLTLAQAERLWQIRRRDCETLLDSLVDSGFLARTRAGAFVRAGSGRAGG